MSRTIWRSALWFIGAFAIIAPVDAVRFIPLGDPPGRTFLPHGISSEGNVVVGAGISASGGEAFRWTEANGIFGLGDLPGGYFYSEAYNASADGTMVVGRSVVDNAFEAFRWTSVGGMVGLGDLPDGLFSSSAYDISADGSVVVGAGHGADGPEAFIWKKSAGMVGLGGLPGGYDYSAASGVSANGSVIVGGAYGPYGRDLAFRWTEYSGMVALGDLPGGRDRSRALATSADGNVVVGWSSSARSFNNEVFLWTDFNGMVGLGDLPGGILDSIAYDVSADGGVVVGAGVGSEGHEAFRWTPTGGMESIKAILMEGGIDLEGWQLTDATGISADGSTVTGRGVSPDGQTQAWVADLRTVIPTPGTLWLISVAIVGLILARTRIWQY